MKCNKSTNVVQAQRLLKRGVAAGTADMSWREIIDINTEEVVGVKLDTMPYEDAKTIYGESGITPAWSLPVLLEMLPKVLEENALFDETKEYSLTIYPLNTQGWQIDYSCIDDDNDECFCLGCVNDNDLIETCVKAIEWLTNNRYPINYI